MLSNREIRVRLLETNETKRLFLLPLLDPNDPTSDGGAIQGSAVDLRLGTWFEIPRLHTHAEIGLERAKASEFDIRSGKRIFVPFYGTFYLHPGNFVLGVTLEWIKMPLDLSGTVTGKSKWGRRGLNVATATLVHPGFVGCLTLELANIGEHPLTLSPGMPVCQLSVHELSSPAIEPIPASKLIGHRKPINVPVELDARAEALSGRLRPQELPGDAPRK